MKQCPKCNAACSDEEVVCPNCGHLFTPEGFDYNVPPRGSQYGSYNSSGTPNQGDYYGGPNQGGYYNGPNQGGYYGGPNQGGYNNWGYRQPRYNGMAIASFVLGIVGVIFSCYGVGLVPAIVGLILGIMSKRSIKRSNGMEIGDGFALAGIVLSSIAIVFAIYMIIIVAFNWDTFVNLYQQYLNDIYNGGRSGRPF